MSRQILGVGLKMVGIMIITRILGPAKYGSYVAAYSIYLYANLVGTAGVGVFLLRHEGDVSRATLRTAYTMLFAAALALCGMLEATRGLLSVWTNVAGYSAVMAVMALGLPFQMLTIPATAQLERALDYRSVAAVEIGGDVAYYALAAALALSGFGAVSLGAALLLQQVSFCILAHWLSKSMPRFGWDGKIARQIINYAGTFAFANWVWQLRMLVNPLIIGPVMGAQAVGLIGMTIGILEMLSIAKTVAWRLSVAVLARIQHDTAKLRKAVTEGMEIQTLVVGAVLLGFGWLGQFIVPIVFGARWAPVMDFYPYIALAYLTIATFNVHSAVMSVIDRNRDLGITYTVHVVLFGVVAWFAVRHVGAQGYGYGELAAIPAYGLMHVFVARQIGSPDYRVAALWWAAAAVGLFWRELGLWAIAVPFIVLALPVSVRRLVGFWRMVRPAPEPSTEMATSI